MQKLFEYYDTCHKPLYSRIQTCTYIETQLQLFVLDIPHHNRAFCSYLFLTHRVHIDASIVYDIHFLKHTDLGYQLDISSHFQMLLRVYTTVSFSRLRSHFVALLQLDYLLLFSHHCISLKVLLQHLERESIFCDKTLPHNQRLRRYTGSLSLHHLQVPIKVFKDVN